MSKMDQTITNIMRIGRAKTNYVDTNSMTIEVSLYVPTRVTDGQGGFTTTFALQEVVWGDFRPDNQNRTLQEAQITFTRMAKLFIRYDVTITDNYQLEVEGEKYTIHSIKDVDNQFRFYEILMYF